MMTRFSRPVFLCVLKFWVSIIGEISRWGLKLQSCAGFRWLSWWWLKSPNSVDLHDTAVLQLLTLAASAARVFLGPFFGHWTGVTLWPMFQGPVNTFKNATYPVRYWYCTSWFLLFDSAMILAADDSFWPLNAAETIGDPSCWTESAERSPRSSPYHPIPIWGFPTMRKPQELDGL